MKLYKGLGPAWQTRRLLQYLNGTVDIERLLQDLNGTVDIERIIQAAL